MQETVNHKPEVEGFKTTWAFDSYPGDCFDGYVGTPSETCETCKQLLSALTVRPRYNTRMTLIGICVVAQPCGHERYMTLDEVVCP